MLLRIFMLILGVFNVIIGIIKKDITTMGIGSLLIGLLIGESHIQ